MAYKISGITSENSRIIVIKQSDWSMETTQSGVLGSFEIDTLVSGTKVVVARNALGKVDGYGTVNGIFFQDVGDRGIFGGGGSNNVINAITVSSESNATDFGDLTVARNQLASTSNGNSDRGVFGGGGGNNLIDYVTISSDGDASTFGGFIAGGRSGSAGASNSTNDRGLFGPCYVSPSYTNTIEYITISSTGDSLDFGDATVIRTNIGAVDNATDDRAVFAGGESPSDFNVLDYVTVSTTGNASDFGDLTATEVYIKGSSNGINDRGFFTPAQHGGGVYSNIIQYITITTTGNASDFGDYGYEVSGAAACSNGSNERGVIGGGLSSGAVQRTAMEYITINSTGDSTAFGDLTVGKYNLAATSNA